jgi:hypothetical protein
MPNEDTKHGRANERVTHRHSTCTRSVARLFGRFFVLEHGVDAPLTMYPASEIPGRRTHQHARTLGTNHTKRRFSPRVPVTCQHPNNTDNSRQADHYPLLSHPHRTTITRGKNDPVPKTDGLRLLWQLMDFHPWLPTDSQRPALGFVQLPVRRRDATPTHKGMAASDSPSLARDIRPRAPDRAEFQLPPRSRSASLTRSHTSRQIRDSGFRSRTAERSCCHSR